MRFMKKSFKKLFVMMMILTVVFSSLVSTVSAESAPSSMEFKVYALSSTPVSYPTTFYVKKTPDGKYAFCYKYNRSYAKGTYTRGSLISNTGKEAGVLYILEKGYNSKDDKAFFVAQTALWIYLADNDMMYNHQYLVTFRKTLNNTKNSNRYSKAILELVSEAKKVTSYDQSKPTISLGDGTFTLSLNSDKTAYVSDAISFKSSEDDYKVTLSGAPTGTTYKVSNNSIVVTVPASSVSKTTTFTLKVSASKDVYTAYKYNPSSDKYQIMSVPFKNTYTVSDQVNLKVNVGKAVISKQDVTTGEELPGATLVVKDSNGNEVAKWVSTNEPKELSLPAGTYTLTETIAPEGYVLSTETISFTVRDDGSTTQVVMKNSPETEIPPVVISKQDATTGEELPGATLVVKDSEGNEIARWVSTDEPKELALEPGTYTLTEIIAPEGYVLSTETISFTVKDDGSVTKVVMKNSPEEVPETPAEEVEVPSTGMYKSVASSLIGGVIVIGGYLLISKNLKKKNER